VDLGAAIAAIIMAVVIVVLGALLIFGFVGSVWFQRKDEIANRRRAGR
jgi:ABC-type antimicrobial peptide transport system permease subunit